MTQTRFVPNASSSPPGLCVIIDEPSFLSREITDVSRKESTFPTTPAGGPAAGRTKTGMPTGGKLATLHHLNLSWQANEVTSIGTLNLAGRTRDERDLAGGLTIHSATSSLFQVCFKILFSAASPPEAWSLFFPPIPVYDRSGGECNMLNTSGYCSNDTTRRPDIARFWKNPAKTTIGEFTIY
jgi:hypothetical protein